MKIVDFFDEFYFYIYKGSEIGGGHCQENFLTHLTLDMSGVRNGMSGIYLEMSWERTGHVG